MIGFINFFFLLFKNYSFFDPSHILRSSFPGKVPREKFSLCFFIIAKILMEIQELRCLGFEETGKEKAQYIERKKKKKENKQMGSKN